MWLLLQVLFKGPFGPNTLVILPIFHIEIVSVTIYPFVKQSRTSSSNAKHHFILDLTSQPPRISSNFVYLNVWAMHESEIQISAPFNNLFIVCTMGVQACVLLPSDIQSVLKTWNLNMWLWMVKYAFLMLTLILLRRLKTANTLAIVEFCNLYAALGRKKNKMIITWHAKTQIFWMRIKFGIR